MKITQIPHANDHAIYAAALQYIAWRLAVFPLHWIIDGKCSCNKADCGTSAGKHPLTSNGVHDATLDVEKIKRWWTKWPKANIAIATGKSSQVTVLDVDDNKGGADAFLALTSSIGAIDTPMVLTGNGSHYYFKYRSDLSNSASVLGPGLDIRNDGGYVVAPPSVHYSGRTYQWEASSEFSRETLSEFKAVAPERMLLSDGVQDHSLTERILIEGGRNASLHSLTGFLRNHPLLSMSSILAAVHQVNLEKCKPPLPVDEIDKLVMSAKKYIPRWRDVMMPEIDSDGVITNEWRQQLQKNSKSGALMSTSANIDLILRNDSAVKDFIKLDRFAQRLTCHGVAPYERSNDPHWVQSDTTSLMIWFGRKYRIQIEAAILRRIVDVVAEQHTYHPVIDWLETLQWDGTARLETFLHDTFDVGVTELTQTIGRNFFISAIARVYKPGCDAQNMLVLDGKGGIGKSRSIAALMPNPDWYVSTSEEFGSKDFFLILRGKWICDMAEMTSTKRSTRDKIKAVITTNIDTYRKPYAEDASNFPRQCVFTATTNEEEYLEYDTGNRRFWPIHCKSANSEYVANARDQLWAEALMLYKAGAKWWEVPQAAMNQAILDHVVNEPWHERVAEYVHGRLFVRSPDILTDLLQIEIGKQDTHLARRVANTLKKLGWEQKVTWENGKSVRGWVKT